MKNGFSIYAYPVFLLLAISQLFFQYGNTTYLAARELLNNFFLIK